MSNFSMQETLSDKRIIIAIHEAIPIGPAHDLRKFLLEQKISELIFIAHPLTYIKEFYKNSSRYEIYKNGKHVKDIAARHWKMPDPFLYIKDTLYTFIWVTKQKKKYDVFFGVDPLNAFAGIMLKRIGKTERVVYYTIDYFTKRFENPLLNKIYHGLDKFCVKYADEIWNLSPKMAKARARFNNMKGTSFSRQHVVPIGIWFKEVKRLPYGKIKKYKIVFIGSFTKMMGIDCIIEAAPMIKKHIPDIRIDIIGSGPEYERTIKKAKDMKLGNFVHFYGWVSDRKKIATLLSDAAVGLAPFDTTVSKDEIQNADPAKLKDYMLWGMPVITTDAVSNLKELVKVGCAVPISYNPKELSSAVVSLLKNEKKLLRFRENAVSYISQFDYEDIFAKNIRRVLPQ